MNYTGKAYKFELQTFEHLLSLYLYSAKGDKLTYYSEDKSRSMTVNTKNFKEEKTRECDVKIMVPNSQWLFRERMNHICANYKIQPKKGK